MLPNIPPKLFSISAVAIGYLLIDDTTANEQNALGNWLMLVAQVLSTNAFYRALMQERGLEPRESTESGKNNSYSFGNNSNYFNNNFNGKTDSQTEYNETIIMLEKIIRALEKEICEIKKKMN
jgi:pullulanase/glycogen debranching enzyme